ncbi:MAG: PEP-utilizing enzyme [Patescibacteria group bacterium]
MNKIFTNEIWTKNWSGNWGFLFGSLYGQIYSNGLKELTGANFKHNLIVFEKKTSANYLVVKELKEFCSHLIKLIINDESLPQKLSDQVIKNTDKIFILMRRLDKKNKFTKFDFDELQRSRFVITTANFSLKKVIDYLPEKLMNKYLDLFTKVRLYTEPVYNETDRLLKKISESVLAGKLSSELIHVLTDNEMEDYFLKNSLPTARDLKKRLTGCAILYDSKGLSTIYTGSEYKKLLSGLTDKKSNDEIKGMVAFKGKAQGIVKIILDPKDNKNFQDGDILVAGMTRPEYLSLMRRSAAFITDAGGLLSHAAIVARELKKPCIVGTEIASKVLKDGDLIEVDANKGIVKILKRA